MEIEESSKPPLVWGKESLDGSAGLARPVQRFRYLVARGSRVFSNQDRGKSEMVNSQVMRRQTPSLWRWIFCFLVTGVVSTQERRLASFCWMWFLASCWLEGIWMVPPKRTGFLPTNGIFSPSRHRLESKTWLVEGSKAMHWHLLTVGFMPDHFSHFSVSLSISLQLEGPLVTRHVSSAYCSRPRVWSVPENVYLRVVRWLGGI